MIEFFTQLYWREPLWMLLLVFPLLLLFWKKYRQQTVLRLYADTHLFPWVIVEGLHKQNQWKSALQIMVWFLFSLAASGPRLLVAIPDELLPPQSAAIVVVDHSRSMMADDVLPSRFQQVNALVARWSKQKIKSNLGLVIFSGAAHTVLPATSDRRALNQMAELLNYIQLPTHGSAIVEAMLQAEYLLKDVTGERAIILLTDGDVESKDLLKLNDVIKNLQQEKISLRVLGAGLPSPVALHDGAGNWLNYNNKAVVTRLNESQLQRLAENKGVEYARLNPSFHGRFANVWQADVGHIALKDQQRVIWHELFSWPLLAAFFLILMQQFSVANLFAPYRFFLIMGLLGLMTSVFPNNSYAVSSNNQVTQATQANLAYDAWLNERYTEAIGYYAKINGYSARMGEGASCFRAQQLDCAISAFSRAAWIAYDDKQRGRAVYNLANSYFKQGDFVLAVRLYKDALRYQPEEANYKNNLEFSAEVLENIKRYNRLLARRLKKRRASIGTGDGPGDGSGDSRGDNKVDLNNERVSLMGDVRDQKIDLEQLVASKGFTLSAQQLANYLQKNKTLLTLKGRSRKLEKRLYDWSRFSNKNPQAANKIFFWQSLFELDENIPAHPETPKVLKGVRPW